jgi:hypothetical protein
MIVGMLVAGVGLLLAGLLAIGYGIQYKEFSVGSTLILSGVVAACTGAIMFGFCITARELRNLAHRLGAGIPAMTPRDSPASTTSATMRPAGEGEFPFTRDHSAAEGRIATEAPPPAPGTTPPWYQEAAARDRPRSSEMTSVSPPVPEPSDAASPLSSRRRNLLFTSTSRKERERTSEPLSPDLLSPELRPNPPAAPQPAATSEPGEPPPASFEDAWPKSERQRPSDMSGRRPWRPPSTASEPPSAPPSSDRRPPQPQEQPPVTVLKSGVVDGMAYSLYSDGSIEAQMPEGMMRFASIDELRAHLDQRS